MLLKSLKKNKNCKRTAIIEDNIEITYKQLHQKAHQLKNIISCTLSQQPLKTASNYVVGTFLPNSINFVLSFLATMLAGKIISPLNDNLTQQETINLIKQCDISLILTTTKYKHFFENIVKEHAEIEISMIYVDEIDYDLKNYVPNALHRYVSTDAKTKACHGDNGHFTKKPDTTDTKFLKQNKTKRKDIFLLLPTSGTTGNAKIVALSKENIFTSVRGYNNKLNYKKNYYLHNRLLILTPFCSSYGIMMVLWSLIWKTLFVVYNKPFAIDHVCQLIENHKITSYEGGAIFLLWLEKTKKECVAFDISSLNYIAFGGSKIPAESLVEIMKKYPFIEVSQGYGMTETSPLIAKVNLSKKGKKLYFKEKQDSVGTAIKGVKIFIRNHKTLTKKT